MDVVRRLYVKEALEIFLAWHNDNHLKQNYWAGGGLLLYVY